MINIIKLACYLLIIISFQNIAVANKYSKIEYKIIPMVNSASPTIKIKTTIYGDIKEEVILNLPHQWAGYNYIKQIQNIKYEAGTRLKINKDGSKQLIINSPENNPITVSYEITQVNGDPSDVHKIIIRKDLIHTVGYGLFITPEDLKQEQQVKFVIKWENLPETWNTLSSHTIKPLIEFTNTVDKLLHSFYVAGDINVMPVTDNNNQLYISLHGNFSMPDEDIVTYISNIIKSQRSFFNDTDFPYYAMSIIESDNPDSIGGTRLHNSFTAYLAKDIIQKKCYFLLAHEHLHNWIGSKLKNNEQEELNKWFTEGFTDYYARVIALKSGGVSLGEFIDSCNLFLQYYFLSPVINEPNTRIESDYWHNYDIRKLSYYRGFVFAIYLNHLIKQNSNTYSLDNVILDLYNITKHDKDNFSSNLFQKIAKPYVGRSITAEISRFIDKGETIDLAELIDILPIEKSVIGRYDPGFDMAIFDKEKVIRNIKKTSNAYKAGLRDGDVIVRHSFWRNNPNKTMILKTKDKIFRFKPVSQDNKVTIYQIKENLSPEEESAIKQFFNVKL